MINFEPEMHFMHRFSSAFPDRSFPKICTTSLSQPIRPGCFRRTNRNLGRPLHSRDVKQRKRFEDWIARHSAWRELTMGPLVRVCIRRAGNVGTEGADLAVRRDRHYLVPQIRRALGDMIKRGGNRACPDSFTAASEFAMLPAHGGYLKPHTDAPNILVVLVIPIIRHGVWDHAWGGGLEICRSKDANQNFNWANRFIGSDEGRTRSNIPVSSKSVHVFRECHAQHHHARDRAGLRPVTVYFQFISAYFRTASCHRRASRRPMLIRIISLLCARERGAP